MAKKYWLVAASVLSIILISVAAQNSPNVIQSENLAIEKITNTALESHLLNPTITPKVINTLPSNAETLAQLNHNNQLSPIDRLRQITEKTALQQKLIEEYDDFHRYPPKNKRIETAQQDPVAQRYAVDERTTLNQDKNMGLTIFSDQKYYVAGNTVHISAFLQDAHGQRVAGDLSAIFLTSNQQQIKPLTLTDENNDLIYETSIELTSNNSYKYEPGIYKVIIDNPQNEIKDALTFTLSKPDIALTGSYRDAITGEGELLIEAQVEITSLNRFYIQASLYSATNVPVGVTQFSQDLTLGKHWVPLTFSGLMIQDSQESGPYVLKKISVAKVTMPMQRAPLFEPGYQTDSYALDEFSSDPFNSGSL